jgi:hypothetical protein
VDLAGTDAREHRTTLLAFHAVGLTPAGTAYGADVTCLPWGVSWRQSRPYLGGLAGTSPDWASVDLFVNNGGLSEWNALVNVLDATGQPTQFENMVYCRVRNVGDQPAQNVTVQFVYAKIGTAPTGWQPVTDAAGNPAQLTLGTLAPGALSFPESQQHTPPAAAGVKWSLPPLAPGEAVDHFCLKAVLAATNDVNRWNNEVQSNIAYAAYASGASLRLAFQATNAGAAPIPLDIARRAEIPEAWKVGLEGAAGGPLAPGEQRVLRLVVTLPRRGGGLAPPLDGVVVGRVREHGAAAGALTASRLVGGRLVGRLALTLADGRHLLGRFAGRLEARTGKLDGRVEGRLQPRRGRSRPVAAAVSGVLEPWRRVHVEHRVGGVPAGGLTLQVQGAVPRPRGAPAPPPTTVRVPPPAPRPPGRRRGAG